MIKDKIRIALVCTSINQLGGKNNHLKNLYKHLNKDDFRIFLVCCSKVERELKDFMEREGVKKEDLILLPRFKKWMLLPFILELKKMFLNKKIDIVHTFQIQSDILGGIAARLAGIKYLFSLYESKIIPDNISWNKQTFYCLMNNVMKKWFIKTIVVSRGLREELIFNKFRPADKIGVIYLGLNIPDKYKDCKFSFNKLKEKRPLIGTISRFSKEKGIDRFIKAIPVILEKLPRAEFILVGKGDEGKILNDLICRLKIESKIKVKDWTNDVFSVLESIDIFVMPSLREGCPHGLLEALALQRPVVASDIEGIRDVVDNEKEALLVDTGDTKLFADKVLSLCDNSDTAIALGQRGRRKIQEEFTIKEEMAQMKNLYLSVFS
jgi:glycosyltransferase involved in cell wall biosynthesis